MLNTALTLKNVLGDQGHPFNSSPPQFLLYGRFRTKFDHQGAILFFFFLILLNLLTSEIVSVKQEPFVIQIFVMKGFRHNFFS